MSSWTGLDFFFFLVFLLNTLLGMSRGATKEIISMMCLSAALVVMIQFTIPMTKFMNSSPLITDVVTAKMTQNFMRAIDMPPLTEATILHFNYCVSLLVCFVGTFGALEAVLTVTGIQEVYHFPYAIADRKLGATLGATRGFVIVLIFIIILEHLFVGDAPRSKFIDLLGNSAKKLDELVEAQAPERFQEILQDKNLYNQIQAGAILNDLMKTIPTGAQPSGSAATTP